MGRCCHFLFYIFNLNQFILINFIMLRLNDERLIIRIASDQTSYSYCKCVLPMLNSRVALLLSEEKEIETAEKKVVGGFFEYDKRNENLFSSFAINLPQSFYLVLHSYFSGNFFQVRCGTEYSH